MAEAEDASQIGGNLTAVEAISAKLAEVTRLAEKLDARLYEAGARIRPVSIPTAVTSSSASSLLSITAVPSPVTPIRSTTSAAIASTSTSAVTTPSASTTVQAPRAVPAEIATVLSTSLSTPSATSSRKQHSQTATSVHERAITMSSDVSKPMMTSMPERPDESSPRIPAHSTEDVQTPSKDPGTKEVLEHPRSESAAEEYNVEGYTTATECSVTPVPRSRSGSFVTSPECEDLPSAASATSPCPISIRWTSETPKQIITTFSHASVASDEKQTPKSTTETISSGAARPTTRIETISRVIDERSGKIAKEVTETTVLRVSHDVRLGVAAYKLASHTLLDHRQHIDGKEYQNVERVLSAAEPREQTGGAQRDPDLEDTERYIERCPRRIQADQSAATKAAKVWERALGDSSCSDLREHEETVSTLSTQHSLMRHHEDSGIEMSPMKKDDNLEGDDFLERARKL